MKNDKLENFIIVLPETFKNILKKINNNGLGIIFITDKGFKLIGSITDGDIRRCLIKKKISNKINFRSKLINKKVFSLSSNLKPAQIIPYLGSVIRSKKINCIPLVDTNGIVVDISTLSKLKRYPLISLDIGSEELKNLTDCIRSGWISSLGPYVIKFEKELKDYVKGKYLTTTTSGTTALELAIKSLGLNKDDEIISSPIQRCWVNSITAGLFAKTLCAMNAFACLLCALVRRDARSNTLWITQKHAINLASPLAAFKLRNTNLQT